MARRIAYITHYAELFGANRSMLDLMLEARRRGAVEPLVILPREGPLSDRLRQEGIPEILFPFQPWMSERHYSGGPHHRLMQHLRQERAARDRDRANEKLLPDIVQALLDHRVDAVHVNSAVVGITPGLLRVLSVPVIWHIRELPERQYLLHIDHGRRRFGRALRTAHRLIAISEAVKSDVLRYAKRAVPINVIYNGVLTIAQYADLRQTAAARWSDTSPFVFVIAGLIHPSKGQEEAVRALDIVRRTHPGVKLVIAGSGKDQRLRELIDALAVAPWVERVGFVDDPLALFRRSHALLMCSRNEAMGRVTVEAMGAGLPVIGHASGGTLELIEDGVNGLIYPGTPEALAERMLRLIGGPTFARGLGDRAMSMAEGRFSVERMTDQVMGVYAELMPGA